MHGRNVADSQNQIKKFFTGIQNEIHTPVLAWNPPENHPVRPAFRACLRHHTPRESAAQNMIHVVRFFVCVNTRSTCPWR